jgi:serine protease Do
MAKAAMDSLISKGKVVRGWLGVSIQSLTPELAKQFGLTDEKGLLVGDIVENGPADKAGLQRGDIIFEIQGKKIEDPNQIRNMIAGIDPGHEIEIKIIRENKPVTINVIVSELPTDEQKPAKREYGNLLKGVSVQELTPEFIERFDIPKKLKGVIVAEVDEDSPAFGIIKPGDIIQEINKENIAGLKDYENVAGKIKQDEDIMLFVRRGQASRYITLSVK